MTLGYESYIIVIVEKYNLKNLKKRLYFEFFGCVYIMKGQIKGRIGYVMYKAEYYDFSGKEGKRIKEDLKNWGFHHLTISSLPADFFRMSKSQLEKLFVHASDAFIARMYDVPEPQIRNRRDDFGIKQLMNTLNRMEREDEATQIFKEILRIVSNEYNNGNIPHTNSTPLNSEKEFLYMKATGIVRRIDDLGRVAIPRRSAGG